MVQQVVPAVQGDGSAEPAEAPTGSAEPAEAPSSPSRRVRPHWRRELLLLVVLYLLYGAIRNLAPDQVVDAQRNARAILGAEGLLGMDVERTINLAGAALPWLAIPANYYYATMHMAVTAAARPLRAHPRRPADDDPDGAGLLLAVPAGPAPADDRRRVQPVADQRHQ